MKYNKIIKTTILGTVLLSFQTLNASPFHSRSTEKLVLHGRYNNVMTVSGGIMGGDIATMPGADLQIATKISDDIALYGGGELAVFLLTGSYTTAAVIPVLGTMFMVFNITEKVHPILGASFGPTISTSNQLSSVRLTFLFNPGISFNLKNNLDLNLQGRFGVIGSSFVAIPQMGLSFAI